MTSRDGFVELRRELHRAAELSGREDRTAALLRGRLESLGPADLVTGIAGHGLAARWRGGRPGRALLIRCELDALPIADGSVIPHASTTAGVAHKCGHDGHMAMAIAAATRLAERPPAAGSVTFLFQPAEETGEGAAKVLADPSFAGLEPDFALSLHNLPGFPLGAVVLRDELFAFGSTGVEIRFAGAESHAAEPERGRSPAAAVAATIQGVRRLTSPETLPPEEGAATVTHARIGEPSFGTSPGSGIVLVTLRAADESGMDALKRAVTALVGRVSADHGVDAGIEWREPFPVTRNDPSVVRRVETCARARGLDVVRPEAPFRWSEDFGHFTARFPGALLGLGAGEDHPALHHPDYDFPDDLIGIGAGLLCDLALEFAADPAGTRAAGERS